MILKKPKFWDNDVPNVFAYLLYPITFLIQFLNFLKIKPKSKNFKIKTICIGNIYVGGTGKTSLSVKINEILKKYNIKSCFVKKFYEGQIDEQKILKKNGKLFLSKKRIDALNEAENENYNVAILDDGLQDKTITYDLKLVCFNNINWIGNGMTIPSGPLRENIKNLREYKYIFLNGNLENIDKIKKKIFQINPEIKIFLGKYAPQNIKELNINEKYIVFSGIGNHQTFVTMLKNHGINIFKEIEFPDHYQYKKNDIDKILNEAKNFNCKIITTEKDFFRISDQNINKINYIKSELQIINEEEFIKILINL